MKHFLKQTISIPAVLLLAMMASLRAAIAIPSAKPNIVFILVESS
jgi:hypothetical protein